MSVGASESVVARVERLERENRRLKVIGGGVLLAGIMVLLTAQGAPRGHIVEAERFVVRDHSGNVRGQFGLDSACRSSVFVISASAERAGVAVLGVLDDGTPTVMLVAGKNLRGPITELTVDSSGYGRLTFYAKNNLPGARLALLGDSSGSRAELQLKAMHPNGYFTSWVSLEAAPLRSSGLEVWDGLVTAEVKAHRDSGASVLLRVNDHTSDSSWAAEFSVDRALGSGVDLYGGSRHVRETGPGTLVAEQSPRLTLGVNHDGAPSLRLYADRRVIWKAP